MRIEIYRIEPILVPRTNVHRMYAYRLLLMGSCVLLEEGVASV